MGSINEVGFGCTGFYLQVSELSGLNTKYMKSLHPFPFTLQLRTNLLAYHIKFLKDTRVCNVTKM